MTLGRHCKGLVGPTANISGKRIRFTPHFGRDGIGGVALIGGMAESCTLALKVIPNAPRHELAGWLGEALKMKIHAPPLEGRANEAVSAYLAEQLGLPRRAVTLLRGDTSRQKVVRIDGLGGAEVRARLDARMAAKGKR